MELSVHSLSYPKHLWGHYYHLSTLPGFALLQSTDQIRGRYDIVTAFPHDELTIKRNGTNPSELWNDLHRMLRCKSSSYDFPFQGGAIGYFAYDFAECLIGLNGKRHLESELPLVDLKFYDWAIIVDHHKKRVDLIAAHQHPDTKIRISDIIKRWNTPLKPKKKIQLSEAFASPINQEEYFNAFQAIHDALKWGRAYQVNYAIPFLTEFYDDPWLIYEKVSIQNRVPYAAFIRYSNFDLLSFSPERCLLVNQYKLLTSPIKGSAPRSDDLVQDKRYQFELTQSEKNRAENIMIVDLLRNDLGKVATPGTVKVKTLCELQSYSQVHHLVSHIEAKLKHELHPIDAFNACFPGGSITGAPKLEAMRIIHEHEPYTRGIYCGNIGYLSNHGRYDINIAIRTVISQQNKLYLRAGGGIVMDSNAHEEYDECYTKIKAILNALTT
ncbi:aminodeoxychorismate synthase component I [Legionella impletisoli]|uniref:aminodeoxychorismate synthase n=1 Tax=Legionella impletisoli TaxID=343510 RepID=A0A917JNY0_9GAMM|nr:aminodeoxychorismate synthase component I [Legionella impletisoli]GGI76105.1 aminodeoxychorismate synthase, component I [Legionella impletisoli]